MALSCGRVPMGYGNDPKNYSHERKKRQDGKSLKFLSCVSVEILDKIMKYEIGFLSLNLQMGTKLFKKILKIKINEFCDGAIITPPQVHTSPVISTSALEHLRAKEKTRSLPLPHA